MRVGVYKNAKGHCTQRSVETVGEHTDIYNTPKTETVPMEIMHVF